MAWRESKYAAYARGYAAGLNRRDCPYQEGAEFKAGFSAGRQQRFERIVAHFKTEKARADDAKAAP